MDVSTPADTLTRPPREGGLTVPFTCKDLSVVAHMCDLAAVMDLGWMVKVAPPRQLFTPPPRAYTGVRDPVA